MIARSNEAEPIARTQAPRYTLFLFLLVGIGYVVSRGKKKPVEAAEMEDCNCWGIG